MEVLYDPHLEEVEQYEDEAQYEADEQQHLQRVELQ
jgi:hypothetical protein